MQGVHLLICEATFTSQHQELAKAKSHSTIEEALLLAQVAGVYRLICTHFSQRRVFAVVF